MTAACPTCGGAVTQTGRRGHPYTYCSSCRPRTGRPARPVKPAHRVYLYCFDLYTHARDDEERHAAWQLMRRAGADAGIPIMQHRPDRAHDLVDVLARWARRQEAARDDRTSPRHRIAA